MRKEPRDHQTSRKPRGPSAQASGRECCAPPRAGRRSARGLQTGPFEAARSGGGGGSSGGGSSGCDGRRKPAARALLLRNQNARRRNPGTRRAGPASRGAMLEEGSSRPDPPPSREGRGRRSRRATPRPAWRDRLGYPPSGPLSPSDRLWRPNDGPFIFRPSLK